MRRMLASLIFLPLLSALSHNHPLTGFRGWKRTTPMFTRSQTFQRLSLSVYLQILLTHSKRCQAEIKNIDSACLKGFFFFLISVDWWLLSKIIKVEFVCDFWDKQDSQSTVTPIPFYWAIKAKIVYNCCFPKRNCSWEIVYKDTFDLSACVISGIFSQTIMSRMYR